MANGSAGVVAQGWRQKRFPVPVGTADQQDGDSEARRPAACSG